jgi:cytoskeleton protein RodZ
MDLQVEAQAITRTGQILRNSRLRAGLDLKDVARNLRIRQSYLEAVETGRLDVFPAPVYALGFVRAYAQQLGLDADEIARRFRAELTTHGAVAPLHFPSPVTEGGAPKAAVLLLGAVIAIGAYTAWYLTSSHRVDVAEIVVPVPDRLEQMIKGRELASPPSGEQPSADRARPQVTPAQESDVASAQDGHSASAAATRSSPQSSQPSAAPDGAPPPGSTASTPPAAVGGDGAAIAAVPANVGSSAATAMAAEPPSASAMSGKPGGRIVLKAKADSWVEVRDPAGNGTLVARLLRSGDVYRIPDRPGLRLVTGNAGGLVVIVDGQPIPPLGKDGAVRRGVPLDPESLRKGAEALVPQ